MERSFRWIAAGLPHAILALAPAFALALGLGRPLRAAGAEALPPPGSEAWRPLVFPGVTRTTRYIPLPASEGGGVHAEARCSAGALALPLEGIDWERTPRLRWRWRVTQPLAIGDERVREGDDFAARVYVLFPFQPERASRWQRLRHRLAEKLFGRRLPGRGLNYVWTSHEPAGATWANPFVRESRMISRGPAPAGVWRQEEVDVRADFERLFGWPAPAPIGVAIMSDSDNSCQEAGADFAGFELVGDEGDPAQQGGGEEPARRQGHPQQRDRSER